MFYVFKGKDQCKIWRLEKEKLLPKRLQQINTGDGEKLEFREVFLALDRPMRRFTLKI